VKSALIVYASLSGNTEEVAELIVDELVRSGVSVDTHRIGLGNCLPNPGNYDAMFIGSYTWARGSTPGEVKDFAADLRYKPTPVYAFGTGDTQFGGDEYFCAAAVKLARFYNSPVPPLKIEQSPRGKQENKVRKWVKGVLLIDGNTDQSEST